jgi:ribosomal protein S18 acetylase RimI-like enzyme
MVNELVFRETARSDIESTYAIRAATRQNPIPKTQLIAWGFTPETVWEKYLQGQYIGWVCEDRGQVVGFCTGDALTGEVIVIALLPRYEGRKIGSRLLTLLINSLLERGREKLWLSASPDPEIRAHGFYRANGWMPTGEVLANGDEILAFSG